MTLMNSETVSIAGIAVPDGALAREITELVRDTESPMLFHHSSRVYYWGGAGRKASRPEVRPRTVICGRNVP
jgi:hypothetical protein